MTWAFRNFPYFSRNFLRVVDEVLRLRKAKEVGTSRASEPNKEQTSHFWPRRCPPPQITTDFFVILPDPIGHPFRADLGVNPRDPGGSHDMEISDMDLTSSCCHCFCPVFLTRHTLQFPISVRFGPDLRDQKVENLSESGSDIWPVPIRL